MAAHHLGGGAGVSGELAKEVLRLRGALSVIARAAETSREPNCTAFRDWLYRYVLSVKAHGTAHAFDVPETTAT